MALPDLTGQNIENTYQRVLQTDGVNVYDGTGSLVTLQYTGSFTGDGSGLTGITAVAAPAGPDQSIQYNNGGAFGGSSTFTFDSSTDTVNLSGDIDVKDKIETLNRILIDSSRLTSIDWENRVGYFNDGTTVLLDWGSQKLYDTATSSSADWEKRFLYDASEQASVEWVGRRLFGPNGLVTLDWANNNIARVTGSLVVTGSLSVTGNIEGTINGGTF